MVLTPDDTLFALMALLVSSAAVGLGISIRLGGSRRFLRPYFLTDLPGYVRNFPLALIPIALAFALGMVLGLLESAFGTRALALIALVLVAMLISIVVGIWWLARPPEFAKPTWLRAEESAARAGLPVPDHRPPRPSAAQYTAGWIVTALLLPVGLAIGIPVPLLLMGVGMGASLLLANPPWGDDQHPQYVRSTGGGGPLESGSESVDEARARAEEAMARAEESLRRRSQPDIRHKPARQ